MGIRTFLASAAAAGLLAVAPAAQLREVPEDFTAVAVANNNLVSGAGTVLISLDRWSTMADRDRLVRTLREQGPRAMLDALRDMRPVGRIRTPDSLGYDLHYAQQMATDDGGRRIVIATDRPIGFWEAWNRPRSVDYPFTVIQMNINREGRGTGTMSLATRIRAYASIIELEDFASSPVMLTEILAVPDDERE